MADLTRLRTILQACDQTVLALGGVIHHMSPDPTATTLLDVEAVRSIVGWLGTSPMPLYGPFVSAPGVTPAIMASLGESVDQVAAANIATYANAMASTDSEWDRTVRDDQSKRVALHSGGAARVPAQSSVEFAALELVSELGMEGVDGAAAAFADIRRSHKNTTLVISHQFARSRHAVFSLVTLPGNDFRLVITPWCLSRRNALAVAAVMCNDIRRSLVSARLIRRAKTAVSFLSRLSLQSVRDVLATATSLLTRYNYDSTRLAFVDPVSGVTVQGVGSRQVGVAVAFSYAFTRGESDALLLLAETRAQLLDPLMDGAPQQVGDYYDHAASPLEGLVAFSRALGATRALRDVDDMSAMRSKGAMLGYVARGRSKAERNTAACLNRIEEVVNLLLLRGYERSNIMLVIDWGGELNQGAILAACALAGVDVALDVAASGVELPGADVLSDEQDPPHRYQLYLSSAVGRALPRVPTCEYLQGEPLEQKLGKLKRSLGPSKPSHTFAIIAGGVQHVLDKPVSVCLDAVNRQSSVRSVAGEIGIVFSCAEVLLPPVCHHSINASLSTYMESGTYVDPECGQCDEHHRAIAVLSTLFDDSDVRLVKPRSVHGHNAYFSLEWAPGTNNAADTLKCLDAAIALSHARNLSYGEADDPGLGQGEFESRQLALLLRPAVSAAYSALSGGDQPPLGQSEAEEIAQSIKG